MRHCNSEIYYYSNDTGKLVRVVRYCTCYRGYVYRRFNDKTSNLSGQLQFSQVVFFRFKVDTVFFFIFFIKNGK